MASKNQPASSGSGSDGCGGPVMDDRKRKRMLSNRESARRSRMKKQKLLEDFVSQVSRLQAENRQLEQQINGATENYIDIDSANSVLRAQLIELTDRLRSLNSLLQVVEEVSGFAIDIPEIPDSLLNPWQMPCPATASAHHCLCSSHT